MLRAGQQRRLDPLRRGRRRQREPRLPRRHAERAGAVRAGVRAGRRVRRRGARPLPLDDDPQRGSLRLLPRRRQAADRGAGGRHRRRHLHARATSCSSGRRPAAAGRRGRSCRSTAPTTTSRPASSPTRSALRLGQARRDAQPGRASGCSSSRARRAGRTARRCPPARRRASRCELFASEGRLRGRYSLDDGATWTEVGTGFALTGLSNAGHRARRVQRHRRGGRPRSSASPSASRRSIPRRATPATPEPGYTMLFDGTRASTEDWRMAGPGSISRAERLHAVHRGRPRAAVAHRRRSTTRTRSSSTGRWAGDDNSGVFVGLPRPGHRPVGRGRPRLRDPDRRHRRSRQHHRRGLQLPGGGHGGPRRRAEPAGRVEQLRAARSRASGSASTSTAR